VSPTAIRAIYFLGEVSIISAIDYFVGFWRKIDRASSVSQVKAGSAEPEEEYLGGELRVPVSQVAGGRGPW
jgi:hypothetical protein